jgi:hypothetical protein
MNFGVSKKDATDFANKIINMGGKVSYEGAYHIWEIEMIKAGIASTKDKMVAKDTISNKLFG